MVAFYGLKMKMKSSHDKTNPKKCKSFGASARKEKI